MYFDWSTPPKTLCLKAALNKFLRAYSKVFIEMLQTISGFHEKTASVVLNCLGYFLQKERKDANLSSRNKINMFRF